MTITYQGRPVAFVVPPEIRFDDSIAVLEADHPVRRWVFSLAVYAHGVLAGHVRGPYDEERANGFARAALISAEDFAELDQFWAGDRSREVRLAEHFNVPLEQIHRKRCDLSDSLSVVAPLF